MEVLKPRAEAVGDAPGSSRGVRSRRTRCVGCAFRLRLELFSFVIMKQFFIIFAGLVCACDHGVSPATQPLSSATQAAIPAMKPIDFSTVDGATVWFYPWSLNISPDGSASIQYGSLLGDSATLPKGTCDFKSIVTEIMRQRSVEPGQTGVPAGLVMKGVNSTTLTNLKDDAYLRKLIESVSDKWQNKGWRFEELRTKYPICPPLAARDPHLK